MENPLQIELCKAAAANNAAEVNRLLNAAANPYLQDESHRNAFNYAANNIAALSVLAETAFRDVKLPKDERRWPGYGLDSKIGKLNATLSSYIVKACHPQVVQEMIAAKADLTVTDDDGWNLLHKAAVMPNRLTVLRLLTQAVERKGILQVMLSAKTTRGYETDYGKVKVSYPDNKTPIELYAIRSKADDQWREATPGYINLLTLNSRIIQPRR